MNSTTFSTFDPTELTVDGMIKAMKEIDDKTPPEGFLQEVFFGCSSWGLLMSIAKQRTVEQFTPGLLCQPRVICDNDLFPDVIIMKLTRAVIVLFCGRKMKYKPEDLTRIKKLFSKPKYEVTK